MTVQSVPRGGRGTKTKKIVYSYVKTLSCIKIYCKKFTKNFYLFLWQIRTRKRLNQNPICSWFSCKLAIEQASIRVPLNRRVSVRASFLAISDFLSMLIWTRSGWSNQYQYLSHNFDTRRTYMLQELHFTDPLTGHSSESFPPPTHNMVITAQSINV